MFPDWVFQRLIEDCEREAARKVARDAVEEQGIGE
jgi:hypothetical protein